MGGRYPVTPTERLLAFASAEHLLPEAVRADAERLLGDTLAVGAAGSTATGADGVLTAARGWGAGNDARLIGATSRVKFTTPAKAGVQLPSTSPLGPRLRGGGDSGDDAAGQHPCLPAPSAAFVSGFRIHCLEWDAVHEPAVVHSLSVVTAALGAVIDRAGGCDPEEALTALAVGVDIASGLGIAATSPLSFFRPATAGVLGAAVAVARITGAPMADTLGLAYSFAGGTMQAHVEGSIALPLQVANAARAAVMAADLASAGLTGPHDVLEGPFGYFRLFDQGALTTYTDAIGARWRISEVSTKPYPSGRASHGALGLLDVQRREGLGAGDVAWIELFVPPLVKRLVGRPFLTEMTPAYARLCLPLLAALMLRDGYVDPRRFTPATFADPTIADLAGRVIVNVDDNPDPNALSPQRARVTRTDASTSEHDIPHTLGSPEAPLTSDQAAAKRDLARLLAPDADPRLFDDPLGWFTEPR